MSLKGEVESAPSAFVQLDSDGTECSTTGLLQPPILTREIENRISRISPYANKGTPGGATPGWTAQQSHKVEKLGV